MALSPSLEQFLPHDFVERDEWLSLRHISRGGKIGNIPPPHLEKLLTLGFIRRETNGIELTDRGHALLKI